MLGTNVIAGVGFLGPSGITGGSITKWNGSSWENLGSGVNHVVNALAVSGINLYVGGAFTSAGGKVSSGIARAILPEAPLITDQPDSLLVLSGATATFSVTALGIDPISYQWRRNGTNLSNGGAVSGVTTTTLTITNVLSTEAGNYTVFITNAYGNVTSTPAVLEVRALNQIGQWPDFERGGERSGSLSRTAGPMSLPGAPGLLS